MDNLGDKSVCKSCLRVIVYNGRHWVHVGHTPRHPATPTAGMTPRTWEYGTRLSVVVADVIPGASMSGVICFDVNDELRKEAFLLLQRSDSPTPPKDARAVIVFTQGGPTGGYWKFEHEEATA